ncbi:hypothetical protein K503DRAFT_160217 [Rhizopogon vinicolor AM-OR11-026]|uniref:Uncharacterized protein n=1 Tax=Rhizopogon vinicolor AM-OR11-026 TaxID=1314800 RepID=A0A1B7N0U9_9AGAM|nr:hypothetical protein K503DRAFT_160217 [Rhizopogon vinicolor AM-OR11-026]
MDRARALMDINYCGEVTVSLEAVRIVREENAKGAGYACASIELGSDQGGPDSRVL